METDQIKLREYRVGDLRSVHEYAKEPDFSRYQNWGPNSVEDTCVFTRAAILRKRETPRRHYDFAVICKKSGCLVRGANIRQSSDDRPEGVIGYAINPLYQNKGFATDAANLLLKFGMGCLKLTRIVASCDSRNVASIRVLRKIGMRRERVILKDFRQKGVLRDTWVFSVSVSSRGVE